MAKGNVKRTVQIIQTSFTIPSVKLVKGSAVQLFSHKDMSNFGPPGMTLVGAVPLWTNAVLTSGIVFDTYLESDGTLSMSAGIIRDNEYTVSGVRVLTFWA